MPETSSLPQNVVHCFPASGTVILRRRVLSVLFGLLFIAGSVFFLLPDATSIVLSIASMIGAISCILILAQSFLIASYRVALDYEQNEVVLRYQFQKIKIPFEDFDTRDGEPDRVQAAWSSLPVKSRKTPAKFLILDNVRDSACYQTANHDLASEEDFDTLKAEAETIRNFFRGKPKELAFTSEEEDEFAKIIASARADTTKNIDE
jgi:hypothetical protein